MSKTFKFKKEVFTWEDQVAAWKGNDGRGYQMPSSKTIPTKKDKKQKHKPKWENEF